MKPFIIILIAICLHVSSNGQTQVNYLYDNSGNRASRKTITLGKSLYSNRDTAKIAEKFTEQIANKTILVYPNPFSEEVNVEIEGFDDTQKVLINIFDQQGRLLITQSQNSTRNIFNLSRYPTGIYFLIISVGNNRTRYTIIKK